MALENKKLSTYDDLPSSNIDETTKLVVITGSVKTNKNLPLANLVENSLSSTSSIKPLSAAKGKQLQDEKAQKSYTIIIDTGDFFPPATSMFPFLMTPGSYGVVFTDPPIAGLNETNFNLKVDYVSHDGSGEDGDQDILQTLTTKDGISYTRRLYHVFHQIDMSATDFKTAEVADLSSFVSTETLTKYTKANNVFIEL